MVMMLVVGNDGTDDDEPASLALMEVMPADIEDTLFSFSVCLTSALTSMEIGEPRPC